MTCGSGHLQVSKKVTLIKNIGGNHFLNFSGNCLTIASEMTSDIFRI